MTAIKKTIVSTFICVISAVSGFAQDTDLPCLQNKWGVSLELTKSVISPKNEMPVGGPINFVDRSKSEGISVMGNYTWHPFSGNDYKRSIFIRPGLGFAYDHEKPGFRNRGKNNEQFLMQAEVMFGYTIPVKNVGIDIFTSPTARIGFKNYLSYSDLTEKDGVGTGYKESYYPGGVNWRFGAGLNYNHVGIYLSYNQPIGHFYHVKGVTYEGLKMQDTKKYGLHDLGSLSLGFILRF